MYYSKTLLAKAVLHCGALQFTSHNSTVTKFNRPEHEHAQNFAISLDICQFLLGSIGISLCFVLIFNSKFLEKQKFHTSVIF